MRVTKPVVLSFLTILTVSHLALALQSATPSAKPTSSPVSNKANAESAGTESSDASIRDEYLRGLDKTFDAPLAATLAGLALAAAAFLLPLEQKKQQELTALSPEVRERLGNQYIETTEKKIDNVGKATKYMIWAFYLFVFALADAIFVHPLAALKGQMNSEYLLDLPLGGGGIVFGVGFLVRGGFLIKKVITPDPPQKANGK